MVRLLNRVQIVDKIRTKTLMTNVNMLSVNQMNAQIKITDVWKAIHDVNRPLKIEKVSHDASTCVTRSVVNGDLREFGKLTLVQSTFLSDASHVWNNCPTGLKECDTLWKAKKAIRKFVVTLPM